MAVNSDRWLCIEITLNDCEKTEQLSAYSQLDPRNLVIYGIDGIIKAPDVVCSRYFEYDEGKFCQIIVNGHLKVTGLEFLTDINLQEALRRSENVDIRNMPDIPITIIPELSDSELKISLCGHVMQLFCPECTPKTAIDIVADGLERLVDFIPITARKQLDRKVEKELDYLVATHLKNYLEKNGDQYQARGEISDHFQVRHKVNTILKQWCSEKRMPTLDDFEDD